MTARFPQVLLLGNGLNRAFDSHDWNALIKKLWSSEAAFSMENEVLDSVPFPLKIVLATNDRVDEALGGCGNLLCNKRELGDLRDPLRQLLKMPFDHILTTNYSYELEMATKDIKCSSCGKCALKRSTGHTDAVKCLEAKYMLHSYNCVNVDGHERKVWHIHGEARKPNSVIIGHYYYGNLLARIQNELNKRGNKQYERQKSGESALIESWVDAFIMGDVYILGFGYDLSEMDLWWLLNRKKREKAQHGRTMFYEPETEETIAKHALLKTYGVDVRTLGVRGKPDDFKSFYRAAIEDIRKDIGDTI